MSEAAGSNQLSLWDALRTHFEARGYRFTKEPDPATLPEFLKDRHLDAVAEKAGDNVIIELKTRRSRAGDILAQDLRNRLEPGWSLQIIYAADMEPENPVVPVVNAPTFIREIDEIESLISGDHRRAAFVLTWSLLEAAVHRLRGTGPLKGMGQLVQFLAMQGVIDSIEERRLRDLVRLRSQVVHGGLDARVGRDDITFIRDIALRVFEADPSIGQLRTAH